MQIQMQILQIFCPLSEGDGSRQIKIRGRCICMACLLYSLLNMRAAFAYDELVSQAAMQVVKCVLLPIVAIYAS